MRYTKSVCKYAYTFCIAPSFADFYRINLLQVVYTRCSYFSTEALRLLKYTGVYRK